MTVALEPGRVYALERLDARSREAAAAAPVAAWLHHCEARELATGTIKAYSYRIDKLLALFPDTELGDFTEAELVAVLTSVPRESKREYITAFVSLLRTWAYRRDLIPTDPTKLLSESFRPRKQKNIDVFTEAEVEALLGLPNDESQGTGYGEDGFRMLLMLDTGLRISELCALRVRDVQPRLVEQEDPELGTVEVAVGGQLLVFKGKGNKDRVVPLTSRLAQAFCDWEHVNGVGRNEFVLGHGHPGLKRGIAHRDTKLSTDGLRKFWWKNALLAAGVRHRTPHTTRHTFATTLIRRGAPMAHVSKMLGHKSVQITIDLYTHLVTADLADAIRLLEA